MELNAQIRRYRTELGLSQEELAEKVFVTRQTVSNWETGKSYPDIHSLLLLGNVFQVSLDQLIKGDLASMKELVNEYDVQEFQHYSRIFSAHFGVLVIAGPFLALWGKWYSWMLFGVLFAIALYWGIRVEQLKKKFDIQTYQEIVAFFEGKKLDELQKATEFGKRPYQKTVLVLLSALFSALVTAAAAWILHLLKG